MQLRQEYILTVCNLCRNSTIMDRAALSVGRFIIIKLYARAIQLVCCVQETQAAGVYTLLK